MRVSGCYPGEVDHPLQTVDLARPVRAVPTVAPTAPLVAERIAAPLARCPCSKLLNEGAFAGEAHKNWKSE